jgi:hypothetical protein
MAFKNYHFIPAGPGAWWLDAPQPFVLSGPNGLIARHVLADRERAASPWLLMPQDLLRMAGSPHPETRWIVFEQAENEELRISRLERVAGISSAQTELLLTLSPFSVVRAGPALFVKQPPDGRSWSEELALDGGAQAPSGTWCWRTRALNIGATVIGSGA